MNYYPHHIGDFNSETRRSSRLERSVYRDMQDLYYEKECPLPLDLKALCRAVVAITPEEIAAVEQVLGDFFERTDEGWFNSRCAEQIALYHHGMAKSAAGGRAKAAKAAKAAAAAASAEAKKAAKAAGASPARTVPEPCEQETATVLEGFEQVPEHVLEGFPHTASSCEQTASTCAQGAGSLREGANQNQNQNQNQEKNNPVAQPTLIEDCARAATPVDLSIALRKQGVNCQPADPRLIALAEQGVAVETAIAACDEAKRSKPDQQVIALGYVVKILERWSREGAAISVAGASPPARASPGGFETTKDRERRTTIEGLTGQSSNEREHKIIDITPVAGERDSADLGGEFV